MSTTAAKPDLLIVPLALIDDPALPARDTIDDEAIVELAESIRANGLIQPLVLVRRAARFEVVAGHRRLIALRMIDAGDARAVVWPETTGNLEALKLHENIDREELATADEARWFDQLLRTVCDGDTDRLAALVRKSREYVEGRLLLLAGDAGVLRALTDRKITFSVAREMNAIHDPARRANYLDVAIRQGVSAATAREWRLQANRNEQDYGAIDVGAGGAAAGALQPIDSPFRCICCHGDEDPHDMMVVYIHRGCYRSVLSKLLPPAPSSTV